MNNYLFLICIIWVHFLSDYILQSRKIADSKHKSIKSILIHGLIYLIPFLAISLLFSLIINKKQDFQFYNCFIYFFVNTILHCLIDFFTSKLTSFYFSSKQYRSLLIILGLDQMLHISIFIITLQMFF